MKITELRNKVPKGSQKRAKHPLATDDPDKYIGKWEKYDEPQGIGSPAGRRVTKDTAMYASKNKTTEQGIKEDGEGLSPGPIRRRAGDGASDGYGSAPHQHVINISDIVPGYPSNHKALPNSEAPLKAARKKASKQNTDTRPVAKVVDPSTFEYVAKPKVEEMVRRPFRNPFDAEYELTSADGEEKIGLATVNDGIIQVFAFREDYPEASFGGHLPSKLLGNIVRDADLANANLSIRMRDPHDLQMRRFFERFGFRHVGDGVMKRNAGATNPPSVHMV